MRALSAAELLDIWERGLAQPPARRAVALLAGACPDMLPHALAELSLGRRDALLLTLREWTFGPHLSCVERCPNCGERLELDFQAGDIQVASEAEPPGVLSLSVADCEVRFRLPNSLDLVAIPEDGDIAAVRRVLLQRCILAARDREGERSAEELPSAVVDAIAEGMGQADPQADVQLALACPVCRHQWKVRFDIVSFFWAEIEAWASRLLREVHLLARAYGWREADILAMSPWRRQCYLEMGGR